MVLLRIGIVGSLLIPPLAIAQKATRHSALTRPERVQARLDAGTREMSTATIKLSHADDTRMSVIVETKEGGGFLLAFERNIGSDGWRPVLPMGVGTLVIGNSLDAWMATTAAQAGPKHQLLPFTPDITQLPHDNVTVFVVDHELVLISLWLRGGIVATYFALDVAAASDGHEPELAAQGAEGQVAVNAPPDQALQVCNKLLRTCMGSEDTYWVFACFAWLYFCRAM